MTGSWDGDLNIGIVYLGKERYAQTTLENHAGFVAHLRQKWRCQVYRFTHEFRTWSNPYLDSEQAQLYDVYQSIKFIEEPIVVKLRTDVWFGTGAYESVSDEITAIQHNDQDISFLGGRLLLHPEVMHQKEFFTSKPDQRIANDFVVVFNKNKIAPESMAFSPNHLDDWSRNHGWWNLAHEHSRVGNVMNQIFPVRDEIAESNTVKVAKAAVEYLARVEGTSKLIKQARAYWSNKQ